MAIVTASDGTRLVTTLLGPLSADPAIMIPGGPCRGVDYLEDLAGAGADRPLVVLHPRGTPTTGGRSRGWWHDADDVIAVLDALGLAQADIVAHSAGTRLALGAAVRHPTRVRSLTLITPAASWLTDAEHDGEAIGRARRESAVDAVLVSMRTEPERGQLAFDRHRTIEGPSGYAHWTALEQAHATVGDWAWDAVAAWFTDIPDDVVAQVLGATLPRTVVIGGADDILTGRAPVHAYAAALGAELIELANCGHYPWVEQPEAFRAALRR